MPPNAGVGIDLVHIPRLTDAISRRPGLAARLFTPAEREEAARRARPFEFLAGRFAAKEASFKALSRGWPRLSWTEIEVPSGPSGRPVLGFAGRAAFLAEGCQAQVSISHERDWAVAYVVIIGVLSRAASISSSSMIRSRGVDRGGEE